MMDFVVNAQIFVLRVLSQEIYAPNVSLVSISMLIFVLIIAPILW